MKSNMVKFSPRWENFFIKVRIDLCRTLYFIWSVKSVLESRKKNSLPARFFACPICQSAASRLKSTEFGAVFFRKPLFLSFFSYFCAGNVFSPHI